MLTASFIGVLSLIFATLAGASNVIDFEAIGAIPNDSSYDTALHNGILLNATVNHLVPGDVFFVPNKTYSVTGGIYAVGLRNVTFQIDGTLLFDNDRKKWPTFAQWNCNGVHLPRGY